MNEHRDGGRDPGAVLVLVLVVAIVLAMVVLALANFVAADLRYSQVVTARAESLSTAESGIDFAISRIRSGQTLCSTDAADSGPVGLNGASAPTMLPGPLNDTVTTITCERMTAGFAAVAGWSVIATRGNQPDAIRVNVQKDRRITGPVYVSDPSNIDVFSPARLFSDSGDIWYRDSTCAAPLANGVLTSRVVFDSPFVRGPICTTANWSDIVSAPPVPDLSGLPVNNGSTFDSIPGPCRVFHPGRYTAKPQIDPSVDVYFQSGDYWFDNIGEWLLDGGDLASAGHPGSLPAPADACGAARAADPNVGGIGATFYFDGTSRLRLDNNGTLEMFPRQHGNFFVSIQALPTSDPGPDRSLVRTRPTSIVHLEVHGLVWSPASRIALDNVNNFSQQRLLGGVVAEQLLIGDTPSGSLSGALEIAPASAAIDVQIRLRSTSAIDGVSTTIEAIVQYRPQTSDVTQRIAVNSSKVVD